MEYLLLIYRKWPETETYWLINKPGLPVSPASPILLNTPSDPLLIPDLLASLTETLMSDGAVYSGYQFINTWTSTTATNDSGAGSQSTDHFVLLGRHSHNSTNSPQSQSQSQSQSQTQTQPQTQNKDKGEPKQKQTQKTATAQITPTPRPAPSTGYQKTWCASTRI